MVTGVAARSGAPVARSTVKSTANALEYFFLVGRERKGDHEREHVVLEPVGDQREWLPECCSAARTIGQSNEEKSQVPRHAEKYFSFIVFVFSCHSPGARARRFTRSRGSSRSGKSCLERAAGRTNSVV